MSVAAFLSSALFVGASAAWHLLRGNQTPAIRAMFSMALWMTLLVAPIQAMIGDMHGLNTLKHQPAKIAAIEGHWENPPGEPTPLLLFGWPDMQQERTRYGLEIPALGSLILTHSLDKQVPALKEFAPEDRPNSTVVFWSFRLMAGLGMLMILLGVIALWLRYRQRLYTSKPFLRFALWMGPSGLIAILAGWVTTEVGRQPWVVYGIQRTSEAVSAHGDLHMTISLLAFIAVYSSVFGVGYSYMLRPDPQRSARADACAIRYAGASAFCRDGWFSAQGVPLMGIDLSVIWFVIIVFATLMYIVMDGFDLGIGILFAAVRGGDERDVMVNSVAPVWDGNETWLVLGGAGLFGAFPLAYAVIIDALSVPLTLMLIGLIFRGVAFEFRFKATPSHRPFWDKAFLGGSLLATFTQAWSSARSFMVFRSAVAALAVECGIG